MTLYLVLTKYKYNKIRKVGDGDNMKTKVDPDLCIACGLCISTCPDVYNWGDDGKARAIDGSVPEEQESCAEEAADGCPTDAINID